MSVIGARVAIITSRNSIKSGKCEGSRKLKLPLESAVGRKAMQLKLFVEK